MWASYLDQRVDNSYVGAGVEHFVEVGLPVDQFQLVELFIVLGEKSPLAERRASVSAVSTVCYPKLKHQHDPGTVNR